MIRLSIITATLAAAGALSCTGNAWAADYRIELMGGWNTSQFSFAGDKSLKKRTLTVELDSLSLGDGAAYGASFWVDDWIARNWSLGFQYLGLNLGGDAGTTATLLGSVPVGFTADSDVTLHNFITNVAWRQKDGDWHPYLGVGLSLGFADVHLDGFLRVARVGGVNSVDFKAAQGGVQGFAGVDYDLSERLYIGLSGRAYYVDGRPVGIDLQVLDYAILVHIGYAL